MFISSIDNMLKHPVDSSFLVRSLVLMAMKYPEAIQDNCPIIYVWLRDNSVSFISAVFDELEVKSIYQDSLHSALSNISFHCIIVFFKTDLCCIATSSLLWNWSTQFGEDVTSSVLKCRKKKGTDSEYLDNILEIIAMWRIFHIIRGVERLKVEQSHHLPVCSFLNTHLFHVSCRFHKSLCQNSFPFSLRQLPRSRK